LAVALSAGIDAGINARELRRKLGGALREAKAVDAACAVLEESGLIRQVAQGGGHRPRKDFQINPRVFSRAR
jgi:hypothetical protein